MTRLTTYLLLISSQSYIASSLVLPYPVAKSVIELRPRSPAGQGGYYKESEADPSGVATKDSLSTEWGKRQDDQGGIEWGKRDTKLSRSDLTPPNDIGGHFSGESRAKRQTWDCSGRHGHLSRNKDGNRDWKRSPSAEGQNNLNKAKRDVWTSLQDSNGVARVRSNSHYGWEKRTPQEGQDRGGKITITRDGEAQHDRARVVLAKNGNYGTDEKRGHFHTAESDRDGDRDRANQTPAKNPSPPAITEKRDEVETTNQTPAFDSAKNPSSGAYEERRKAADKRKAGELIELYKSSDSDNPSPPAKLLTRRMERANRLPASSPVEIENPSPPA